MPGVSFKMKLREAYQLHIVAVITSFCYLGMHNDFVPSEKWSVIGICLSIISGIFTTKFLLFDRPVRVFSKNKKIYYLIISLLLFTCISWVAIVHGIPFFINKSFGASEEVTVNLQKSFKKYRHACSYKVKGEFINKAFPPYLCVEKEEFENISQNSTFLLNGSRTWFGYQIEKYEFKR